MLPAFPPFVREFACRRLHGADLGTRLVMHGDDVGLTLAGLLDQVTKLWFRLANRDGCAHPLKGSQLLTNKASRYSFSVLKLPFSAASLPCPSRPPLPALRPSLNRKTREKGGVTAKEVNGIDCREKAHSKERGGEACASAPVASGQWPTRGDAPRRVCSRRGQETDPTHCTDPPPHLGGYGGPVGGTECGSRIRSPSHFCFLLFPSAPGRATLPRSQHV